MGFANRNARPSAAHSNTAPSWRRVRANSRHGRSSAAQESFVYAQPAA